MTDENKEWMPRLRFPEFGEKEWNIYSISDFLQESQIAGSRGDIAKKLSVKLWGKGVAEKKENYSGSAATRYYKRRAGQFIYSKLDFLNQAFGIIPDSLDNFESTIDLPCFDFKKGLAPLFFLNYVLRPIFYKKNGELADGGRKAKRIQQDMFLGFPIAIPGLSEQQKIADCLSSLDELIEAHEQKRDALLEHKKGLMQRLFPAEGETTPRWRFPEFRKGGVWKSCCIKDAGSVLSGYGFPDKYQGKNNGEYPFYKVSDISLAQKNGIYITHSANYIDNDVREILKAKSIPPYTIIFARIGEAIRLNRRSITTRPSIIDNNVAGIKGDEKMVLYLFLYYTLSMLNLAEFSSGVVPAINKSAIEAIQIIIPSLPEQQKIADCLSSLDTRIEAEEAEIASLREHRQGLMQRLFPQSL